MLFFKFPSLTAQALKMLYLTEWVWLEKYSTHVFGNNKHVTHILNIITSLNGLLLP